MSTTSDAQLAVTLKPLEVFAEDDLPAARRAHGEVMVSTLATIYKKLRLETNENLGWGRIHLPEVELHTTAYWLAVDPAAVAGWRRDEVDLALVGAGRALRTVASILLMSDPRDLGLVTQVRSPHAERPVVYLYEGVPGGVGLAPRLFERHEELALGALDLVRDCPCSGGCPACTGPRGETGADAKRLAERLLTLVAAGHGGVARVA
jgi:DEAD/DEAH box helicase domain-containing protein